MHHWQATYDNTAVRSAAAMVKSGIVMTTVVGVILHHSMNHNCQMISDNTYQQLLPLQLQEDQPPHHQ